MGAVLDYYPPLQRFNFGDFTNGGNHVIQDSRSLYYLIWEITLQHFDIHHNNINKHSKLHCKIKTNKQTNKQTHTHTHKHQKKKKKEKKKGRGHRKYICFWTHNLAAVTLVPHREESKIYVFLIQPTYMFTIRNCCHTFACKIQVKMMYLSWNKMPCDGDLYHGWINPGTVSGTVTWCNFISKWQKHKECIMVPSTITHAWFMPVMKWKSSDTTCVSSRVLSCVWCPVLSCVWTVSCHD